MKTIGYSIPVLTCVVFLHSITCLAVPITGFDKLSTHISLSTLVSEPVTTKIAGSVGLCS